MAMTHDYLDYLNEKIGISPANSEEELQAAQIISDLMSQHDVEPVIEDFDDPKLSGLVPAILAVLCLLGILFVGVGVTALTLIGLILAVIPAVLSLMRVFGHAPKIAFGPRAQSQNVIAVHKATGPLVTKGSRTIVVCAHYDTPRENFLYTSPVAPYVTLLSRLSVPCSFVVAVCALLQIFAFLPSALRVVLWLVGIVAAVPAVVIAAGTIATRWGACTDGANDNKSGVAAMLGVLENVRPSGATPKVRDVAPVVESKGDEGEADEEQTDASTTAGFDVAHMGEVIGVRHGEEVLRSLGILPETCEIEYAVAPAAPVSADAADHENLEEEREDEGATAAESTGKTGPLPDEGETSGGSEADATLPSKPSESDEPSPEKTWGKASFIPKLTNLARRASLFDLPDPSGNEVDPLAATDPKGRRVDASDAKKASSDEAPVVEPLETIGAPAEGSSKKDGSKKNAFLSFLDRLRGKVGSADEDLESLDEEPDGDSKDDGVWRGGATTRSGLRLVGEDKGVVDDDQVVDNVVDDMVDQMDEESGELTDEWYEEDEAQDEEFDDSAIYDDEDVDADFAEDVEDEETDAVDEVPTEEELRDEILSLSDDELLAHDIWFVALGGSSLDHAGMRSFLANHRSEIRGCFVINLDSIGAGRLVTLKNEGLEETRRADRRISRLLNTAAADLHVELGSEAHDWADTDATPAMRSSLRSITIMGVGENGLPALSGTPEDVAENVDGVQASSVAALVTEVIRRS